MKTSSKVFWTAIIAFSTVLILNNVSQGDSLNFGNNNATSHMSLEFFNKSIVGNSNIKMTDNSIAGVPKE